LNDTILEVVNLKKYFRIKAGVFSKARTLYAIDGVSFKIKRGETFGLVGESGCGKTTTGLTILRVYDPTDGEVLYEGKNILKFNKKEMHEFRRKVQLIFQDPLSSLNPMMTVFNLVGEPLSIHFNYNKEERKERVKELMVSVGLAPHHMSRYPHEFSGGQQQRIAIARALATNPSFIVADEPLSGLDISIRGQILNMLQDLKEKFKLTLLFISHDLSIVKMVCNSTAVMYVGKIVELAPTRELFNDPRHPYTKALISAVPVPDPKKKMRRAILKGDIPSPITPPKGCRFHPRCTYAREICRDTIPELTEIRPGHTVSCHLVNQID
jgi:oligopeptide/dipeptide ABC transporter ATP-binding protein